MNTTEIMQKYRIGLTPEYEGGWHADIYQDSDTYDMSFYGDTIEEALGYAVEYLEGDINEL